jgi:hypothetical protein
MTIALSMRLVFLVLLAAATAVVAWAAATSRE